MKLLPLLTLFVASPAIAATEPSVATLYSGYYSTSGGYSDRFVVGTFGDLYSGAAGYHFDLAHLDREQNAQYGAVGLSYALSDKARAKVMVGSSTRNDNILPSLFLLGSVQFKPADKWVVTPQLIYRRYRQGGQEIAPSIQAAHYFNLAGDSGGYYVAQGDAGLSFTSGGNTGWSGGAGLTSLRKSGLNLGANVRAGHMAYDSIIGTGVRSNFVGGGVSVGHRIGKSHELYVRADYSHTRFYDVTGAMLGLKIKL